MTRLEPSQQLDSRLDDLDNCMTFDQIECLVQHLIHVPPVIGDAGECQHRLLPQDSPALEALNTTIENLDGTVRAQGGSLGLEIGVPGRTLPGLGRRDLTLLGEATAPAPALEL